MNKGEGVALAFYTALGLPIGTSTPASKRHIGSCSATPNQKRKASEKPFLQAVFNCQTPLLFTADCIHTIKDIIAVFTQRIEGEAGTAIIAALRFGP